MVLEYAHWALERNQEVAVKIFTDRLEGEKSEKLQPHSLLEFLKPYSDATLLFLENLVHDKNSTVSLDAVCKENPRMVRIRTLHYVHIQYVQTILGLHCANIGS